MLKNKSKNKLTINPKSYGSVLLRAAVGAVACLVVSFSQSPSNFAIAQKSQKPTQSNAEYDQAMAFYKARDYKSAIESFRKCISSGKGNAVAWLYLGHSYLYIQQSGPAATAYQAVAERFPNTPASQEAIKYLTKLDPVNAAKRIPASSQISTADTATFIDRISVHPPADGHPAVCQATLEAVRAVVRRLPPQVYKYLSDGKATITIAPNIVDKWPDSGDGAKPTDPTTTMGEEGGRTYNHDVHIYERPKKRGINVLLECRSPEAISITAYHEIGHAVDDIGHFFSEKPAFKAAMQADLSTISAEMKKEHQYCLDSGEAFAETFASLVGSPSTDEMVNEMKRTREHVKALFRL